LLAAARGAFADALQFTAFTGPAIVALASIVRGGDLVALEITPAERPHRTR
jgi:hypothetical protein